MAAKSVELKKHARVDRKALQTGALQSACPLWMRAPQRDEKGRAYSDFMLLIPGLKQQSGAEKQACQIAIQQCLKPFADVVVYIDLNIKLSLLWVSHKPLPGITTTLVQTIQQALPQARVIAADFNVQPEPPSATRVGLFGAIRLRLTKGFKRLG